MPRITFGTIVKILLASLAVGLVLAYLNLTPQELFQNAFEHFGETLDWAVGVFGWSISYVLLGAVVVVPIWLLLYLLRALKARR